MGRSDSPPTCLRMLQGLPRFFAYSTKLTCLHVVLPAPAAYPLIPAELHVVQHFGEGTVRRDLLVTEPTLLVGVSVCTFTFGARPDTNAHAVVWHRMPTKITRWRFGIADTAACAHPVSRVESAPQQPKNICHVPYAAAAHAILFFFPSSPHNHFNR